MSPSEQLRIVHLSSLVLILTVVTLTSRSWGTIALAAGALMLILPPVGSRH